MKEFLLNHIEAILFILFMLAYILVDYWFIEILPKYGTKKEASTKTDPTEQPTSDV